MTLELATGVRFYTDNNDFLDGKTLQVRPLYSLQAHLIYSITPGIWVGLDGLYYTGGRGIIDGNKGESLENARVGLTLALPVNRYNSIKLYGTTGSIPRPAPTSTNLELLGNCALAAAFRLLVTAPSLNVGIAEIRIIRSLYRKQMEHLSDGTIGMINKAPAAARRPPFLS